MAFFVSHFDSNELPGGGPAQDGRERRSGAGASSGPWPAYPNVQIQTRAQFEQSQMAQVNQLLGLIYALLGLAVVIALIGIVNTLMLSVFERTHEIGLLRAVGMKRRQIRAMIRSESVILAVFGAVIGIVVGTALGIALSCVAEDAGFQRDRRALRQPGRLPDPGRGARPGGRGLAGSAGGHARRPGRHRGRLSAPLRRRLGRSGRPARPQYGRSDGRVGDDDVPRDQHDIGQVEQQGQRAAPVRADAPEDAGCDEREE